MLLDIRKEAMYAFAVSDTSLLPYFPSPFFLMCHITLFKPGAATLQVLSARVFRRQASRSDSEKFRTASLTSILGELPEKHHWRQLLKRKAKQMRTRHLGSRNLVVLIIKVPRKLKKILTYW